MSPLAHIDDVTTLSDAELGTLLARLKREEQDLSKRRSRLHDRLDFVQTGGAASAELAAEQLASLRAAEHDVSEERRRLHQQIDELQAERSRRNAPK